MPFALGLGLGLPKGLAGSGAPPSSPNTWAGQGLLGINTPLPFSYAATRPWRNLVHQVRFATDWVGGLPTLKADGYPAPGQDVFAVFAEDQLGSAYSGVYAFSVNGNNVPNFSNAGPVSATYNAGTNKTTGTVTVDGSLHNILGFTNITADFGDLRMMQPGYALSDPELFTPEWLAHIQRTKVLRTMDLQWTNLEDDVTWVGSRAAGSNHVQFRPGSVSGAMQMAAAAGAQPWLCLAAGADDDYIAQFTTAALALLPAGQLLGIEIGNEPWNGAPGFIGYPTLLNAGFAAAQGYSGNTTSINSARRILSVTRAGNEVTITLASAHGKSVGQSIYSHADAAGTLAHGVKVLTTGTTGSVLKYIDGASGTYSGNLDTSGFGSYLYLDPAHSLVTPLASYGGGADVPGPTQVKAHYELQRLRLAWATANALGKADRIYLVRGTYVVSHPDEVVALARAQAQYGDLDWLDANGGGLAFNMYMTPTNPSAMVTANDVFTQLEASRVEIRDKLIRSVNMTRRFGLNKTPGRQRIYEWGPHNHIVPDTTVGAAVQAAHRDDPRMGALLAGLAADMRNRGTGVTCYFTSGTQKNFGTVTTSGESWGLHEGAAAGPSSQVKDAWFSNQGAASAAALPVSGVTWGDILLKDVLELTAGMDTGGTPGSAVVVADPAVRMPDLWVLLNCPSAGSYRIELDGAGWFSTGDTIAMDIDGTTVASAPIQQFNFFSALPVSPAVPPQLGATVTLTAGWHWLRIRLQAAPRAAYTGLYRLRCASA